MYSPVIESGLFATSLAVPQATTSPPWRLRLVQDRPHNQRAGSSPRRARRPAPYSRDRARPTAYPVAFDCRADEARSKVHRERIEHRAAAIRSESRDECVVLRRRTRVDDARSSVRYPRPTLFRNRRRFLISRSIGPAICSSRAFSLTCSNASTASSIGNEVYSAIPRPPTRTDKRIGSQTSTLALAANCWRNQFFEREPDFF